jgi:hypothetical protein
MTVMIHRPKFATEGEEADWYAANPDYVLQQLERAEAAGRLGRGTIAKQLGITKTTSPIPLVLSSEDLKLATSQARIKGVDLNVYVESLVHDALVNESQR